jgi:hypothetical protein
MKHPIAISIICTILFAFGLALLGLAGYESVNKLSTANWLSVSATVDSVKVYESKNNKGTKWCPDFTYSFTVSGTTYRSNKIEPTLTTNRHCFLNRDAAEKNIKKLPVGSAITAYYAPSAPSRSAIVIQPIGMFELFLLISSFTFISVGIGLLLEVKRHFQKAPKLC